MVNDPISDLLSQIKNGYQAKKAEVSLPWSKSRETIAKVMAAEGYVASCEVVANGHKQLLIKLRYSDKQPAITEIKRVSRPSLRVYVNKNNLPKVLGGLGISIISTPMGIMTGKEAKKKQVGGEVICKIW
ncbi:30S ribosomal protein S8 [Candidatus Gottesmanbacteria bacterium RIFCSPHIGHO2_01_FULL_47_48]|uniref:Small ribosomal subunit protein uS8 n=1 Tax=Candidatus Gottesmanbacteria bacterium RIFCSPHIGHO2_01_FULL_47_48 TaxID=1798381 RepID=A0A1F6A3K5_9BACT|nr:MAG: 30S ribosomal protein S8 [Candidatus Gottesmanbacteria bacterium RIFCSPHIGHO2_01_FULL_47_48]